MLFCKLQFRGPSCIIRSTIKIRIKSIASKTLRLLLRKWGCIGHWSWIFIRELTSKFGPKCFFCILEGHFKSNVHNFGKLWRILSFQGMKRLCQVLKLAGHVWWEKRKLEGIEKPRDLETKKMQAVVDKTSFLVTLYPLVESAET